MPGRHITHRQVARCMHARQAGRTQAQAADSADICERHGRCLDHAGRAAREPRSYRTRDDPLAEVWSTAIVPLLRRDAQLKAVTLLCELQICTP